MAFREIFRAYNVKSFSTLFSDNIQQKFMISFSLSHIYQTAEQEPNPTHVWTPDHLISWSGDHLELQMYLKDKLLVIFFENMVPQGIV